MRISKNMIAELLLFKEHECKAIEEYLEEKALEGWMLSHKSCDFLSLKNHHQLSTNLQLMTLLIILKLVLNENI